MSLLLALAMSAPLLAQGMRDLVDAALDEKITQRVQISEQPVREALRALEQNTGLQFRVDEQALDWMPYGEQTRLSIVIEDMSVRQALRRIFAGLGLTLSVQDDRVVIEPAPVLDRLGRRLTIDEVQLLQMLASQPWKALKPGEVAIDYRLPTKDDHPGELAAAIEETPSINALVQLEAATRRLGWYWVPAGRAIAIYSQSENVQQRLDRPLDARYRQVPLDHLLMDIGRRIGVTIQFEEGALKRVAASERRVDFIQRGTTARQVLELIAGHTGLWYEVTEDGVAIGATTGEAEAQAARPRVVAILRVPVGTDGTTVDFLFREDELPVEFQELRDRKLPEVIEVLRRELAEQ